MRQDEKIIMYDSNEAAKPHRLEKDGWVTPDGHWYENEDTARYHGCTHKRCDCGSIMRKGWLKCDNCISKKEKESYEKLEFKEWDGKTPVAIYQDDHYFFDEDQIFDYCEEYEIKSTDLQLVICKPNYLSHFDGSMWEDELGEDQEFPEELLRLIGEINDFNEKNMINWGPSKFRTTITIN
jgi:hypothetical protein